MSNDRSSGKPSRIILGVLIALAFVLRLGWGLGRDASDHALAELPDQVEYLTLGRHLLQGEGLWFVDPRFGDRVQAFRMPGYPVFVMACGGDVRIIRIVQAVLDAATVLAVFLLARRLMRGAGPYVPLMAAAIVAFNPMLIYVSSLILSETLFTSMLAWGMVLLIARSELTSRGMQPRRMATLRRWLPGGLLLAMAVLVRPSSAALPAALGIAALFVNRGGKGAYHSSQAVPVSPAWPVVGMMMVMAVVVVLAPWAFRNQRVLHRWIWTDTNSGITLIDGYHPGATGASDQRFLREMTELRGMNEVGRSHYLAGRASEFIRENPGQVFRLIVARAARMWSPVPLSDQFGTARHRLIGLLFSLPLDLLVFWGACRGKMSRQAKVFLLTPAIYLTVVHALTIGSLRYRLPAEPPLAILAASVFNTKANHDE